MSKWGNRFKKWFFSEIEAEITFDPAALIPKQTVTGTLHVSNPTTNVVRLQELTLTFLTTFKDITMEGNEFNREADIQEVPIPLSLVLEPGAKEDVPFSFELTMYAPSSAGAPYSIEATLWDKDIKRVWFDVLEHIEIEPMPELKRLLDATAHAGLEPMFVRNVIDPLGEERPYPFVEKYGFKPVGEWADEFEVVKSFWRLHEDGIDLYYWLDNIETQRTLESMATDVELHHRSLTWEQLEREQEQLGLGIQDTLRSHRSS